MPAAATRLSAIQRERLRLYLRILAASAMVGALYGALVTPAALSAWVSMLIGALNGIAIAGCLAGFEIFVLREGTSVARLLRMPFVAVVALKTLLYTGLVSLFVVGLPKLAHVFPGVVRAVPLDPRTELVTIGFAMATTLVFVILLQAARQVGRRTFANLLLGRYRRPRAERRFFLFVDVVGSTATAERLGPLEAHHFLSAVFSAVAEPVAASGGEIYQYVGDEIVVTWPEAEGIPDARPLRCFFMMEESLQRLKEQFQARFGAQPGLRAALHVGEVIAGEVGETRRAIVYHGDVMNTASRLEQATREQGVAFIASAAALEALGPQAEVELQDLGELALRGRKEPIRASAVKLRK